MTVQQLVLDYVARKPAATNTEVAEWVKKQIPGAKTTAASVSSIKTRARGGEPAPKQRPQKPKTKHAVPGGAIRATLARKGVDSVNTATEWAAVNGITPSRIVAIVRGKRLSVPFEHADEIALALDLPELWQTDWAEWALPVDVERLLADGEMELAELFSREDSRRLEPGDRVVHENGRKGKVKRRNGDAVGVAFDDGREQVVSRRKLRSLTA